MSNLRLLILAGLIGVALAVQTLAQSTFATITGTITDPTGAAVPSATVEARNINTGYVLHSHFE